MDVGTEMELRIERKNIFLIDTGYEDFIGRLSLMTPFVMQFIKAFTMNAFLMSTIYYA